MPPIFNVNTASFNTVNIAEFLEVTGSVYVHGSVHVNNTPLSTLPTNYGGLFFNTGSNLDVNPPFASFRFNTNPHDWQQPVTRITMDFWDALFVGGQDGITYATSIAQKYGLTELSYSQIDKWYNYVLKLFDIINNGLTDTVLVLKSADFPATYKQFKIKGGTAYYDFDYDNNRAKKVNWGDKLLNQSGNTWAMWTSWNVVPTDNKVTNPIMFTTSNYYSESLNMYPEYVMARELDNNDPISTWAPFGFSYFDLNVEEIASGFEWWQERLFQYRVTPVPSTVQPKHCTEGIDERENDLFWVDFIDSSSTKRKIIHFVTSSINITIPDWTEEITTICIGAGGGGGGGASGFKHSDSIPFYNKNQRQDVTGSPGNRVPASDRPVGHEFVTGGGGGAGGCVAIETLSGKIVKSNRGNILNITVGSPGKGGIGSSYLNDVVAATPRGGSSLDEINRWKTLSSTDYLFKTNHNSQSDRDTLLPKSANVTANTFVSSPFAMLGTAVTVMSPSGNEYNGKSGGDTFISLSNNIFVLAKGGNGGTAGLAIRDSATTYHLMCNSIDHSPSIAMVPGGANKLSDCIGSDIRIGGPGGYGITMPSPKQKQIIKITPNTIDLIYYQSLWEETIFANKAIDVPWKINDNFNPNSHANNVFPIGNTVRGNLSPSDMYLKYSSNGYDIPIKPAPTGGGGGCGVSFSGVDQRSASVYEQSTYTNNHSYLKDGAEVPNDFFQRTANLITGSISLGIGGTNTVTEYLINEADETGTLFSLQLNSTGSYGGYGRYGIETDNNLSPNNVIYQDLQPQSGEDFGYGGGGGAGRYVLNHDDKFRTDDETLYPTKGQDGADGGRGLAIIIFE